MSGSGDRASIAVVGGGIAGVSAALALAESGAFRVTLFEKGAELGGLCRPYRDGAAAVCDRYYHVILPSDEATLAFIERMGLGGRLHWTASRSGFFRGGRTAPFSSSLDFARFPFLSPWGKFRLGWGIFRASRMKSPAENDERPPGSSVSSGPASRAPSGIPCSAASWARRGATPRLRSSGRPSAASAKPAAG